MYNNDINIDEPKSFKSSSVLSSFYQFDDTFQVVSYLTLVLNKFSFSLLMLSAATQSVDTSKRDDDFDFAV